MQIVITEHAKESFRTRIGCDPDKYQKIAEKAWRSSDPVLKGDVANQRMYEAEKQDNSIYRKFMGRVFVFAERNESLVLVTLYPPVSKMAKVKLAIKSLAKFYGDPKCPHLPINKMKKSAYDKEEAGG